MHSCFLQESVSLTLELLGPLLSNFLYIKCSALLLFRSLAFFFFPADSHTALALFTLIFFFFLISS